MSVFLRCVIADVDMFTALWSNIATVMAVSDEIDLLYQHEMFRGCKIEDNKPSVSDLIRLFSTEYLLCKIVEATPFR